MRIINYSQEYESLIVKLWNECLVTDTVSCGQLRKQVLFDENFNRKLALIAIEDEEVVGFILATERQMPYLDRGLEPERGWINLLFVREDYRKKGIGSRMIKGVEERLKEFGVKNITVAAYSPNYFFPGIDQENYKESIDFFEELSYVRTGETVSM